MEFEYKINFATLRSRNFTVLRSKPQIEYYLLIVKGEQNPRNIPAQPMLLLWTKQICLSAISRIARDVAMRIGCKGISSSLYTYALLHSHASGRDKRRGCAAIKDLLHANELFGIHGL